MTQPAEPKPKLDVIDWEPVIVDRFGAVRVGSSYVSRLMADGERVYYDWCTDKAKEIATQWDAANINRHLLAQNFVHCVEELVDHDEGLSEVELRALSFALLKIARRLVF